MSAGGMALPSLASGGPAPPPGAGRGPLRHGNPRGNPNLAPRCGARTRAGAACRAPAMANGRCRMHGGLCTGPRTAEGMARMIAAHTTHGMDSAPERAMQRYVRALVVRTRLYCQASRLRAHLPAEMAARLRQWPPELMPPVHPSNLGLAPDAGSIPCNVKPGTVKPRGGGARGAKAGRAARAARQALRRREIDRRAAQAEAAARAPWQAAIAVARAAERAARKGAAGGGYGGARGEWHDPMQREAAPAAGAVPAAACGALASPAAPGGPTLVRSSPPRAAELARGMSRGGRHDPMQREGRGRGGGGGSGGGMWGPTLTRRAARADLGPLFAAQARIAGEV